MNWPGARRMLAAALEAEVGDYVTGLADERDGQGWRLVTRNDHGEPRTITTAVGGIEIQAPRVNDRRIDDATGERCGFKSVMVPPQCRKRPKVSEVLPLMYLRLFVMRSGGLRVRVGRRRPSLPGLFREKPLGSTARPDSADTRLGGSGVSSLALAAHLCVICAGRAAAATS